MSYLHYLYTYITTYTAVYVNVVYSYVSDEK